MLFLLIIFANCQYLEMKKIQGLTILFLLLSTGAFAQLTNLVGQANNVVRERSYTTVEGDYLFTEEWSYGEVIDNVGDTFDNLLLNYDTYNDQVIVNKKGSELYLDAKNCRQFIIYLQNNTKVEFMNGLDVPGLKKNGYYQVVHLGEFKILKRYETDLVEQLVEEYGTSGTKLRFVSDKKYIYVSEQNGVSELKPSKKGLELIYGPHVDEMNTFVKKNKLKYRSDDDLGLIFKKLAELRTNS